MVHSLARSAAADEYDAALPHLGGAARAPRARSRLASHPPRVAAAGAAPPLPARSGSACSTSAAWTAFSRMRLQQLGAQAVGYDISPAAIAQAKTLPRDRGATGLHHRAAGTGAVRPDLLQRGAGERRGRLGAGRRAGGLSRPGGSVVGTTPIGDEGRRSGQARDLRSRPSSSERCHPMAGYTSSTTRAVRSATACRSGRRKAGGSSSSRSRRRILRLNADRIGRAVEHVGAIDQATRSGPACALPPSPARRDRKTLGACTTQAPQPTQRAIVHQHAQPASRMHPRGHRR